MACLYCLSECSSTHDKIEHFINPDESNLQAVYTYHQTKGRGQYGNSWNSEKNLNLAYSCAVQCDLVKLSNHLFNFHTAQLLSDFLANMTHVTAKIKWPNDIIINQKKVAGILIEKKIIKDKQYFLIGIGLNILQKDFGNLPKAGSLLTQTGINYDLNTVTHSLHAYLVEHLLKENDGESVLKNFNQYLFRRDLISVFEKDQVRQNGIIKEVDEEGFLWVELEHEGLRKFYHKEIALLY